MKLRSLYIVGSLAFGITTYCYDQFDVQDMLYRIDKCIVLLDQFNKKNKKIHAHAEHKASPCPDNSCEHELVKLCIKKMACNDDVFSPVIETWKLFKQSFKDVDQELFAREFATIVCAVYQQTLSALNIRATHEPLDPQGSIRQQISITDVITLYNKIASLPIREIIDSLEELYKGLRILMVQYGINADTSWKEWLGKNWWVPPVVAASLLYTIFNRGLFAYSPLVELDQE